MLLFKKKIALQKYLRKISKKDSIGFVPTMGAIHEGHLHLIKCSKKTTSITVCSIFVNPTQFNNQKDFNSYPKTLDLDIHKLKGVNCDILYAPDVSDLYLKNEKVKNYDFKTLAQKMEGKYRPGHFNGVATVVEKLLKIVDPDKTFFGQKDLQQTIIVRRLVKDLNIRTEVVMKETIREKNMLAKSSRNKHLTNEEKEKASIIYKILKYCKKNKVLGIKKLKEISIKKIEEVPSIKLEYIEFVETNTMLPINKWKKENTNAVCVAAWIRSIRLIDNIIL